MRWTKPSAGDLRRKEGFLFFAKGSVVEGMRWLEYAKWTEVYDSRFGWKFCWWDNEEEDE